MNSSGEQPFILPSSVKQSQCDIGTQQNHRQKSACLIKAVLERCGAKLHGMKEQILVTIRVTL